MAEFTLTPYPFGRVFIGADGWLYNDIRSVETGGWGGSTPVTTTTTIAYFEPYIYKNVLYLKFSPRPGQGFEDHYLSVNRVGYLGLYKWFGATGWKLDFESHLVSVYNGCNVAVAHNRYKADNSWPGLRFGRADNPVLWDALDSIDSATNSLTGETTATYGGSGGSYFGGALPKGVTRITKLCVRAGTQINALTVWYSDSQGGNVQYITYGNITTPGTWTEFALNSDESIVEVHGRADNVVRQLTFKTDKGRTFGPYGPASGNAFSVTGKPIVGFTGKCGVAIDSLGFMRLNSLSTVRTQAFGGQGGDVFDATPPPGASRVFKVNIHAGNQINTIKVGWIDAGGGPVAEKSVGGSGQNAGTWSEIVLMQGHYITEVSGMADTTIRQISFKLNNGYVCGPYGTAAGTPFRIANKELVGFYGRGGWAIDQLGCVVIAPPVPKASAALEFNGVDTHVIYDGPLELGQQVTLEMWVRGAPQDAHQFWLTDDARRRQFSGHIPWKDGNVYFDVGADANNNYDRILKSIAPHDPNAWNHWAFVRNAATGHMAIYKNGAIFHEVSWSTRPMANCNRFVLGADGDGNWRHTGALSEVRLWSTERTAAQIKDNMNRVIQGPETGLVLCWSLEAIQADQVVWDASGSGRHGKLMGVNKSVTPPTALTT